MGRARIKSRLLITLAVCAVGAVLFAVMAGGMPRQKQAEATFPGINGRILFETTENLEHNIYSIGATGGGLIQQTDFSVSGEAQWSPDGTKIAFWHIDIGPPFGNDIYLINTDGSGLTNITNGVGSGEFTWAPDGSKLAFRSGSSISTIDIDGTNLTFLTSISGLQGSPDWSPDGTKIAYIANNDVHVMNADGTGKTNLTNTADAEWSLSWSPDGAKIAYRRDTAVTRDIYVINADGTGETALTGAPGEEFSPVWSPDGTKIAYFSSDIYTMNANGTGVTNLTNGGLSGGQLDWQPVPTSDADLIVKTYRVELETGGDCDYSSTKLGITVVVSNIGTEDTGSFAVDVDGPGIGGSSPQTVAGGLTAGSDVQLWFNGFQHLTHYTITVDFFQEVGESNESNNQATRVLSEPTLPPTCTSVPTATPTVTPTITPTPTPKDPFGDTDGDTIPNGSDPNDDNDGCTDIQELGPDETLGGRRNPHNPWDFYDVAIAGAVQGQDQQIDLFNDIVSVIDHYAPTGLEPEYDVWYDRGPTAGPNSWNMTAPDGKIDLFNDIVGVINQFGHDCR